MCLSQNIKRFRLEKKLTQEQLASSLGVSAQAVSKWEVNENYPDGALLVPLANQLGVSLDELFGNNEVYFSDILKKTMRIIAEAKEEERFNIARDIGWHIARGLMEFKDVDEEFLESEANEIPLSCFLNDYGFTLISNAAEPFFSLFPEPKGGFGKFIEDKDMLSKIFSALSSVDTLTALEYLYKRTNRYVFESAVLARDCGISDDKMGRVMSDLTELNIVSKKNVNINGQAHQLYYSNPSQSLIAAILMAKTIKYNGPYRMTAWIRKKPFISK